MLSRLDPKTRLRTRITLQAGLEYLGTGCFLWLFHLRGLIDASVVWSFAAIAVCNNTIFLGTIASGLSKRFRDPSMTAIQMFASCCRDLLGMLLAPAVWYVFAFNLFIALPFGSLQFQRLTFAATWLFVSLGLGAVLFALPHPLELRFSTPGDLLMLWAFLVAALARLMLFNARISDLRSKLRDKLAELDAASRQLAAMATHDELTGLYNRREFNSRLAAECEHAARAGTRYFVAIVDADHFKQVNDRHGHAAGDWVLRELSNVLTASVRHNDLAARLGGEEFGLLLLCADENEAMQALQRIRTCVERHAWSALVPGLSVTVSIGAAQGCRARADIDAAMRQADAALYEAKRLGRNRVELFRAPAEKAVGAKTNANLPVGV
jgi:diguanylate cyclase (GGDEF)-like protein